MYGDGGFFFLKPVGAGAVEPVREYGYHMAPHGLAGYGATTRTLDRDDPATAGVRYRYDDSPLTYPELARFYRKAKALGTFSKTVMDKFKDLVKRAEDTANFREVSAASEYMDRNPDGYVRDYIDRMVRRGEIRPLGYGFSRLPDAIKKSEIGYKWLVEYVGPRVEAATAMERNSSSGSAALPTGPTLTDTSNGSAGTTPRFVPSLSSAPAGGFTPSTSGGTNGSSTPSNGSGTPRNGSGTPRNGSGPQLGPPAGGIESQPQLSFTPGEVPFVGGTPGDTKEVTTDETPATVAEESFLSKYGLLLVGGVLVTGAVAYYYRDSLGFGSGTEQK